jgi:hypothetical protein
MESIGINESELKEFLVATKSTNSLSILQNVYPTLNIVFNHPVGKEILRDDINRIQELLIKAYRQVASDSELAELRYLRDYRLPKVINRVNAYLKSLMDVKRYSANNTEKGDGNA